MSKKHLLFVILLFVSVSVLSALPEFWLGGTFAYDVNFLSEDMSKRFSVYNGGGDRVTAVNSGGFSLNTFFVPYKKIKLGLVLDVAAIVPVGYDDATGTYGYLSRHLDGRLDLYFGLGYTQMFSPRIGGFIEAGMKYSRYRVAQENEKNQRVEPEIDVFDEWSVFTGLSLVWIHHSSYFKLTSVFDFGLFHDSFDMGIMLSVGAGYIF